MRRRALAGVSLGLVALLATAGIALAHPLGNFTVNRYAGLRVGTSGIAVDLVVDLAEIPTFQERIDLDLDGDGEVSDEEADAARVPRCEAAAADLEIAVAGRALPTRLTAAGLSFPHGAGGLPTLRLVCELEAAFDRPLAGPARITVEDRADARRLGWREIVVEGDGATIASADTEPVATRSLSHRLTAYPADRLATPLDVRSAAFTAEPGGARLAPFVAPDAVPLAPSSGPGGSGRPGSQAAGPSTAPATDPAPGTTGSPAGATTGGIPGGVAADVPDLFRAADLTLPIALLSILVSAALGAGHALTPGHGKTLMAAALVATRGRSIHALALGLAVSVSHTLGILVLAALVAGAEQIVAPDVVVRLAPLVAALLTVAIGGWMLATELLRRRAPSEDQAGHHDHAHGDGHDHRHSALTWRGLFALGLAGGIVPSTNALLILLVSVAVGRAAFGLALVLAFGLGMAIVLIAVGVATVHARGLLDRLPRGAAAGRVAALAPVAAATFVLGLGLWLTGQAISGTLVL